VIKLTDFLTFVLDNSDNMFRYWVKKTTFTPLEQYERYSDQSLYENDECYYAYINDAIELPDGDILLELRDWECSREDENYTYYKLSEIHLGRISSDNDEEQ
jgi:hypothetical protein